MGEIEVKRDPYARGENRDEFPRCWRCNRILAEFLSRPWKLNCGRCKATNNNSLSLDEALDKFVPNKKTNGMVCSVKKVLDRIEEPTKSKLVALLENKEVLSLDLTTLLKNYGYFVSAEVMRRHRRRAKGGGCSCPI